MKILWRVKGNAMWNVGFIIQEKSDMINIGRYHGDYEEHWYTKSELDIKRGLGGFDYE